MKNLEAEFICSCPYQKQSVGNNTGLVKKSVDILKKWCSAGEVPCVFEPVVFFAAEKEKGFLGMVCRQGRNRSSLCIWREQGRRVAFFYSSFTKLRRS